MKCYRHVDRDAIAICKHCTKGLCAECARDVSGGTVCGDSCAEAIARAERLLLRSDRSLRVAPRFAGVFLLLLGLSVAGWGSNRASDLLITTGTLVALGGAVACWFGWRSADLDREP